LEPNPLYTFRQFHWNETPISASYGSAVSGERIVASKKYIIRQAAILLEFAKTTKDPNISAALIDKAADIKDRDNPLPDRSPQAPDIEPPR
jgi:hypothetical protein